MNHPPPYKPTAEERALAGCYSACHALAAAARRLLAHDADRTDLAFILEATQSQIQTFEADATERTAPVLGRIARKYTRTPKESRR